MTNLNKSAIMLTCLKSCEDESTQKFFKDALKYGKDETCPKDTVYHNYDYEILSKPNKRKLAREERKKFQAEGIKEAPKESTKVVDQMVASIAA